MSVVQRVVAVEQQLGAGAHGGVYDQLVLPEDPRRSELVDGLFDPIGVHTAVRRAGRSQGSGQNGRVDVVGQQLAVSARVQVRNRHVDNLGDLPLDTDCGLHEQRRAEVWTDLVDDGNGRAETGYTAD
ncbi:MAG: hypothetical protein DMG30_25775 [Acidobacteria bacterium]|nr:MAG: hypothetical protein DMG30_25775 [Acidobacteriota bacterium]